MEQTISVIADICGILGFIISIFAATGVTKIYRKMNSNKVSVEESKIGGDFIGRDKITK